MDSAELALIVALSLGDYSPIRSAYVTETYGIIREYLYTDSARVPKYRNMFKRAINAAFYPAFEQGIKDGGGELPPEAEDEDWIQSRIQQEWGFIDGLFSGLRDFKRDSEKTEYDAEAADRAEGYARSLDGIYSQGKIRGAGNKLLWFGGPDGKESCKTCQKLKAGAPHRASYWKNKGLIVFRGNDRYECGCWQCEHYFYDKDGNVYTF